MENFYKLSAFEIREKILKGEIKSEDVVKDIFERIEKIDNKIGSFVNLRKEKALAEAKIVDEKIKNGEIEELRSLVPETTFNFLISAEGKEIEEKLKNSNLPH